LVIHFADIAGYIKDNLHPGYLKEELPLNVAAELEYQVEKETLLFKSNLAISVFTHNGVEPIPEYMSYCLAQLVSVREQLSVFLERRGGDFNAGTEQYSPEISMVGHAFGGLLDVFQSRIYSFFNVARLAVAQAYCLTVYPITVITEVSIAIIKAVLLFVVSEVNLNCNNGTFINLLSLHN